MRLLVRSITALAAAGALLTMMASLAMAGGWAQVVALNDSGDPPVAGEEHALRYRLLQHGVTPVDHGTVQVTATLPETSGLVVVQATSAGDGEWVATLTLPTTGDWQIAVAHADLETSGVAPLTVVDAAPGVALASPVLPGLLALAAVAVMVLAGIIRLGLSRAGRRGEAAVGATAKG